MTFVVPTAARRWSACDTPPNEASMTNRPAIPSSLPGRAALAGLLLAGSLLVVAPAHAQPAPAGGGVCVVIDASRDTLADGERSAARSLVLTAFENEKLAVDASGGACAETYVLSNVKLGNTVTVTIGGPRGQRTGRATSLDDLANVYSQMVRSLVTGAPMETGGGTTDRTNVTKEQSAPRRVAADSLKYVQLGYGGVIAGRFAYGPAFGGGWRKELDRIGIDLSVTFMIANDTSDAAGATMAIPRLMGLWYQDPIADSTIYYGLGLSYGFAAASDSGGDHYGGSGLQGHLVAGYEAFRSSTIRGFAQLEATAPFYQSDFGNASRYTPSVSMVLGLGWGKSNVVRVINE